MYSAYHRQPIDPRVVAELQALRRSVAGSDPTAVADITRRAAADMVTGIVLADGVVTSAEEEGFQRAIDVAEVPQEVSLADLVGVSGNNLLAAGRLADGRPVEGPVSAVRLDAGEMGIVEVPAQVLKEERQAKWTSNSVSIPLGKGFTYRVGTGRAKVSTMGLVVDDEGLIAVTNRRLVVKGQRRREELTGKTLADVDRSGAVLRLWKTRRTTPIIVRVPDRDEIPEVVTAAIAYMAGWAD